MNSPQPRLTNPPAGSAASGSLPVPFFRPPVGEEEATEVRNAIMSGWLTTGPATARFEQTFAEMVGANHAVAVNSATAAMHLSLVANGVGPGDEVIVPTLTFASGAEVVIATGATPVFVDVVPDSLAINLDQARAKITAKTRAIMPMHYGGMPLDLAELMADAESRGILVLDDAAHAFPAYVGDRAIGGLTHGTSFSFYANKTITTGEGGMFTTNDEELAQRVRRLSLHGLSRDAWKRFETRSAWDYDIMEPGWKYNMTDVAAAMGVVQLGKAADLAEQRRHRSAIYDAAFANRPGVEAVGANRRQGSACHLYVLRIVAAEAGVTRSELLDALADRGIGTSVHYRPLHMHSYFRQLGYEAGDFPVAAQAFDEILSLPLFPTMSDVEQDTVIAAIDEITHAR